MTTRDTLRQKGEAMRRRLFGSQSEPLPQGLSAPAFGDFLAETEFGIVWSRPGLALPERMMCTLAALASVQRPAAMERYAHAALNIGLDVRAIQEVLIQIGIYAGFTASEEALAIVEAVCGRRGVPMPAPASRLDTLETLTERGTDLMHRLHRDGGTQGYASPDNPVTGALYPVAIQYGYGEIWFRPGLTEQQRVLVSVASFTALRLEAQTRKFGQAALNMGCSRVEVREAVLQTAPFSGFAPALNALAALSEVLRPE